MSKVIEFAGPVPSWGTIKERADARGLALSIRMIDNLPAFPDEEPEPGWTELRFAATNGMMTLRRLGTALDLVVWGNADGNLQGDWVRLAEILRSFEEAP